MILDFKFWILDWRLRLVLIPFLALAPFFLLADAPAPRELAYKQQHVRERYEELEKHLARLNELLAATDSESAARVQAALKASREGVVLSELQEVIQSLLASRTKTATERQSRVVEQLQRVLNVLQGQDLSWEDLQKQLANLQQLRDSIQKLIDCQTKLEQQSSQAMKDAATGKPSDAAALDKQKAEQAAARDETGKVGAYAKQPGKFPSDTVDPGALDRAAKAMQQAEQALGERKPADANAQQQAALDELQAAIGQLQSRLDQAKARQQERTLSELKDGLKAMLGKQKTVTAATGALDKQLDPKKPAPRETTLRAASLAADETALAERSDGFVKKLQDDGTSAVFGKVLQQTAGVLRDVEGRLKKVETGEPTQQHQKLAEANFQELLEALEEEQARRAAAGAGGGGGGAGMMKTMLLPPAAELKMLRMLQDRVNRGTRSLDEDRKDLEKPTAEETAASKHLSQREAQTADVTEALRKKWNEFAASKAAKEAGNPLAADPLKDFLNKMRQDDANPLTPVGKDMRTVEDQLGKTITGRPTQQVQTRIIRSLNDLIASAEQAQSQAMAMPQMRQRQPAKLPGAAQQSPRGNAKPSGPATVSTLPPGDGTKTGTLNKVFGGGDSDAWGRLPPEAREKFLQTLKEKFPDRYQEILTEYFKQLSTSTPPAMK